MEIHQDTDYVSVLLKYFRIYHQLLLQLQFWILRKSICDSITHCDIKTNVL